MAQFSFIQLAAQSATSAGATGASATGSLLMLVLIFVVFYFFLIRPQSKRQKELREYRNSLTRGEKVVTTGGIYGKIAEVRENYVILDLGGDIKIRVDKAALLKDMSQSE